jgi:hypothetical protein
MIKEVELPVDLRKWHRWFAWYPVTFWENHRKYKVWLSYIDRKLTYSTYDTWSEYRLRSYYF